MKRKRQLSRKEFGDARALHERPSQKRERGGPAPKCRCRKSLAAGHIASRRYSVPRSRRNKGVFIARRTG